jgi:formate dehydrogenase maturation protein FdhE
MADIKEIFGSGSLSEELQTQIQEAWETKLSETREEISAELREEFAQRYENDKSQIVEAMDNMMSEALKKEISEFADDKAKVVAERVAYKKAVGEHSNMLSKFITDALVKEVTELRGDRDSLKGQFTKLENFVVRQLSKELTEFEQDKKDLVERKVKLVSEGKKIIEDTKAAFVKRAAGLVENTISSTLKNEMKTLKDDIKVAKENNFGRKVFVAFAGEYMSSYLSEGGEIRKLQTQLTDQQNSNEKLEGKLAEKDAEVKTMETKVKIAEDKINRERTLNELVAPLSKNKREVMTELLESVQTANLRKQFDKYLPAVLNESTESANDTDKVIITEHTGDREVAETIKSENEDIVNIKRLAGLRS